MARIRTAEVHGHFHRLPIALIVTIVLLATGGTLFGLSQTVWNTVQGVQNPIVPPVPVEPVITPATTPTQTSTPTPVPPATIEVKWETNGPLTPRPSAFGISKLLIQDNVVYALEPMGPEQNRIWKSSDKSQTWNETKESVFSGDLYGMTEEEKELYDKLYKTFQSQIIPSINLGIIPMELDRITADPNNNKNLLASVTVLEIPAALEEMPKALKERIQRMKETAQTQKLNTHRIFLSLDGGKSWIELNHPPGKQAPLPSISLALISSQQYVSIYVGLTDGTVWQTTLNIKSLTTR